MAEIMPLVFVKHYVYRNAEIVLRKEILEWLEERRIEYRLQQTSDREIGEIDTAGYAQMVPAVSIGFGTTTDQVHFKLAWG